MNITVAPISYIVSHIDTKHNSLKAMETRHPKRCLQRASSVHCLSFLSSQFNTTLYIPVGAIESSFTLKQNIDISPYKDAMANVWQISNVHI